MNTIDFIQLDPISSHELYLSAVNHNTDHITLIINILILTRASNLSTKFFV